MPALMTDDEIRAHTEGRKELPQDWRFRLRLRDAQTTDHQRAQLEVDAPSGQHYRIILRQNKRDIVDFSAILACVPAGSNHLFRLRRYNGASHRHTNPIEGTGFHFHCHVHYATERYQLQLRREDHYAEIDERFSTLNEALDVLLTDCGFTETPTTELRLFP